MYFCSRIAYLKRDPMACWIGEQIERVIFWIAKKKKKRRFLPPFQWGESYQQRRLRDDSAVSSPLSQDNHKTLVLMWLANFANDASSMVRLRSSPWHIPCQPYGRLSIVVHYPSVSIRAAQSGLQSAPACRMQWVCHHLFRSYDRNLSNIANIRLHSVSGHTTILHSYNLEISVSRVSMTFSTLLISKPLSLRISICLSVAMGQ